MDNLCVVENKISNYNAIDLFKFLMAICVVAIHTAPLSNCDNDIVINFYSCVVECAVPYFFLCSGFLLGKKLSAANSEEGYTELTPIIKQLKRILKMYGLWTLLYLPLTIIGFYKWNYSLSYAVRKFFTNILFVGENYNSWSLWYLLSTIYSLVFVLYFLKKHVDIRNISIIGLIIIILSFFVDIFVKYNGDLPVYLIYLRKIFENTTINGRVFRGLFYIPFGIYLAQRTVLSAKVGLGMLIVGFCSNYCFEGFLSQLSVIMSAIGLFLMVVNIQLPASLIYSKLRNISTDIYLLHLIIWSIYYMVVYGEKTFGFDCFFFTLVLSVITSLILSFLKKLKFIKIRQT